MYSFLKKLVTLEFFDCSMYKMMENGNMDRLRKYWDARKPTCIESAKKTEIHVTLKEFSCGPEALCFGICSSLLFLIMENLIYHRVALLQCLGTIVGVYWRKVYPYVD